MIRPMNIVIAGASGYIGRSLIPRLIEKFPDAQITALSRSAQLSQDSRVVWKPCDLFSLKSLEAALPQEVDLAIYLVHSMGPTAQLDQGSFADYDLILADNFARIIKKTNIRHLIYLGGLTPDVSNLSAHLESRLEVEMVFAQHHIPNTVFRAGLILGENGSSFQILLKLVGRLPIMICPSWTNTLTTPVDLDSVLSAIVSSAMENQHINRSYDLAGCPPLTYVEMMKETANKMGKKRYFLSVPFFSPKLSSLWVSLVTNSPKGLVYPLIESLAHPMVARPNSIFDQDKVGRSYSDLLEKASLKTKKSGATFFRFSAHGKTVRSVQRLPLATGQDALWIKKKYFSWLPRFFKPLIDVEVEGTKARFFMFGKRFKLLELDLDEVRSDPDRQVLYITDGLLVSVANKGRLEFRVVLDRKFILASIHDYRPALPWYVYVFTQAKIHLWVMKAFAKHLKSL
jgi:uncharacterized protein YbjT (DUF2867 family)